MSVALMNIRDAAKALRVCERVVYDLCRSKCVKAKKIHGSWMIEDLQPNYITTELLAAFLKISKRRAQIIIKDLFESGAISATKIGRQWRIDYKDGLKLIARRG